MISYLNTPAALTGCGVALYEAAGGLRDIVSFICQ